MNRNKWVLSTTCLAMIMVLTACGRSPVGGIEADGGFVGDGDITVTDGPPACVPDCVKICALQKDCGLIAASAVAACQSACQANPSTPELKCLAQQVCATPPSCTAAKACKTNPRVPDLTVSHSATSPGSGLIRYVAKVCNTGNGSAGNFRVHFYRNRSTPPQPGQSGDRVAQLGGLAAGACQTVAVTSGGVGSGTYSTWAQVDPEMAVVELRETNNLSGPRTVKVSGTTVLKPDLVVANMSPQVNSSAGVVTYTISVCNNGQAVSSSTVIDIYVNRTSAPTTAYPGDVSLKFGSLAAGTCVATKASAKLTSSGTYRSWARVDRQNYVAESNENNNLFGPVIFTSGGNKLPDLVVTALAASASPTGLTYFKVSVCNYGQAAVTNYSYLWLYAHRSTAPGPYDKPSAELNLGYNFAAGTCKSMAWQTSLKPGTYKAWAMVDGKNGIKESNESNNTYGPVSYTVSGGSKLPDLVVSSLAASASSTGVATYKGTVCNKGTGSSGYSYLGLYYNLSTTPGPNTKADKLIYIGALPAGSCVGFSWAVKLKPGTYVSWGMADASNAVSESSEFNNTYGPIKFTVGSITNKPDLVVSNVTTSQTSSGYTYYQLTLCNKGNVAAGSANLDLYFNRSSAPPATLPGNLTTYITNLGPGACTKRTMAVVLSPGSYASWVTIDRSNVVSESNESNNVYGPVKVVVPGTGKPDLQIINASVSQTSTYTYYYITVCNKGTAKSGTTYMDIYYNASAAPPATVPGNVSSYMSALNPGACTTRTGYATLPGGSYSSWIRIDRTNVVYESNENNNVYGPVKFTVKGTGKPDLYISKVTHGPYTPTYHRYYVTVCNKGTANAGYARIDLYYNRSSKPSASDPGDRYTTTSTLTPGACTTRTIYAMLGQGSYNSWLWVDRTNSVLELNESNNMYGPMTVKIGGTGKADLVVTGIKTTMTSSGYLYYYVTVCNKGTGASGYSYVDVYYNRSSAPPAYLKGDRSIYVQALSPGACTTRTTYAQLPSGYFSSWARADRANQVAESNENNNVYGPVKVAVTGKPDLVVTQFTAFATPASMVIYQARVCNIGKATSVYTYLDIYYNRSSAPSQYTAGDTSVYVSALAAGACANVQRGVSFGGKKGTFVSWARIDRVARVSETNENNNVSSPYKFTIGGTTTNYCPTICTVLVQTCKMIPQSQYPMCVMTCSGQPQSKKDCAYKQAVAKNCNGIISCM